MQLCTLLLAACVMQVAIVSSQAPLRNGRRQSSVARRSSSVDSSAPTSLLPTFFSRAFGGEAAEEKSSARPTKGGANRRQFRSQLMRQYRRPFAPSTLLPGFPGVGPYAAGTLSRRRNVVDNHSPFGSSIQYSSILPISPISAKPSQASLLAASSIRPIKSGLVNSRRTTVPVSLDGWLSYPTEAPLRVTTKSRPVSKGKAGVCGSASSYGIKCRQRMDQCSEDRHCPGSTRCCMVGDCGYMCVKPKASSSVSKKKRWGVASSVLKRQREAESQAESSTTSAGLKLNDIAVPKNRI